MISCLKLIQTLDNLKGSYEKTTLDIIFTEWFDLREKMTDISGFED